MDRFDNMTCVHLAAKEGNLMLLKILCENGGDPTIRSNEGTALEIATQKKNTALELNLQRRFCLVIDYLQSYLGELTSSVPASQDPMYQTTLFSTSLPSAHFSSFSSLSRLPGIPKNFELPLEKAINIFIKICQNRY